RDRVTGATLLQVTNHSSISHPTYFLQSSFTPNGSNVIFTSYRVGSAQLFEADLRSGDIRQLTDGPAIHPFSPLIAGEFIVFVRGGSVWRINRQSLEEAEIVNFADGQLGECSLSADGDWLTAAIRRGSQAGLVVGRMDGADWKFIPFERTVIHPQFHPVEPDWLIFAGDPAPRMYRIRRDGSGLECLYQHGNDEFLVHETFLGSTGNIVFTVWPRQLCQMDWTTRQIREIVAFNAWHIASNKAGTQVLCDTNHPDRGIFLIGVADGSRKHICMSDASNGGSQWRESRYALADDFARARSAAQASGTLSWMEASTDTVYGPQWTHPHPSFSADEKRIAFASDRTGTTQVYVADIESL
ncbi:MAG TPA: oligogalacturonate lyase family protein, partial [Bryobacteraceae bacterium]|nr:oligogalacturonate lyase family protein [Bryobacteraceae bacterium]